jgi:lambda repressor-like predicted transcriptional regulator
VLSSPWNAHEIASMAAHRGKILEECIKEKGYSIAAAAIRMNISRRTLYNYFEDPELAWQKLVNFEENLHLDLTSRFTQLSKYRANHTQSETVTESSDADYWRNKYIDLLEKYTRLLEKK